MSYRNGLTRRGNMEQDLKERNLAITTLVFDAEFCAQLRCGDATLFTIGAPAGPPVEPTVFNIYRENLEYGFQTNHDDPTSIVRSFLVANYNDVRGAWAAAMKTAYCLAVDRVNELVKEQMA